MFFFLLREQPSGAERWGDPGTKKRSSVAGQRGPREREREIRARVEIALAAALPGR